MSCPAALLPHPPCKKRRKGEKTLCRWPGLQLYTVPADEPNEARRRIITKKKAARDGTDEKRDGIPVNASLMHKEVAQKSAGGIEARRG